MRPRNGERTRPACRFGRPAQTFVSHSWSDFGARRFVGRDFRRAAENCTPAACAPPAAAPHSTSADQPLGAPTCRAGASSHKRGSWERRLVGLCKRASVERNRNGERTRPACRFGRPAQTFVSHSLSDFGARKFVGRDFRRAAENCTPAACAPLCGRAAPFAKIGTRWLPIAARRGLTRPTAPYRSSALQRH